MSKLPAVKSQDLVRALEKMGFAVHHRVGSHVQLKHPDGRRTTIAVHHGKEVPRGTLRAILRQIDSSSDELKEYL
jgi:predicted RNA binding protein YcfA (HicA-like mRNA interferase family)